MYIKDFDKWTLIKKRTNAREQNIYIREREVRWVLLGVNIGSEMDGKGDSSTRPALILHVIGKHLALVAPISTKIKPVPGYLLIERKDSSLSICIHQIRVISQKRILGRKGKVSHDQFQRIQKNIRQFYNL